MRNKNYMLRTDAPVGFMVKMMEVMSGHDTSKGLMWLAMQPLMAVAYCYFWMQTTFGSMRQRWRRLFMRK